MSILEGVLLGIVGLAAGTMNAIVGGGSLLTVPALIQGFGMSSTRAVGSNRFVLIFMTITSSIRYWYLGRVRTDGLVRLLPGVIPGAFIGAMVVGRMQPDILERVIGGITILFLLLLFVKPDFGTEEQERETRWWSIPSAVGLSFVLGMYGGFYGAGVSTLLCFTMIFLIGSTMIQGIGTAQILALFISIAASTRFGMDGNIAYIKVIPLGMGMVMGGFIGPRIAVTVGNRWIKIIFATIVAVISLNMLFPGVKQAIVSVFS